MLNLFLGGLALSAAWFIAPFLIMGVVAIICAIFGRN